LLGANRNKDDEFGISLSTMPFNSLRELLNDKKTTSKYELAKFIAENRILTVILSILSTLSHHQHRQIYPHFIHKILPDLSSDALEEQQTSATGNQNCAPTVAATTSNNANKGNNLYWAKGTGFGTGSTIQQWDAERTLMQQKMEEEHVTYILQILSSYIKCFNENDMLPSVLELFDHSCVITALSSYLRNDSVLDMSRHVPLYKASLELLQSFVRSTPLRELIEKCNLFDLLKSMKQLVDCYTSKIK
jgi:baculoviral IAP repeat-containing protein 6